MLCLRYGARQHASTAYSLTTSWELLQESELQQLTELHSQLQRYHAQCSCQQAALASIASAAVGTLRQLQPSQSLTSSADSGSAQHTLDPKPQMDLSLALAEPMERPEDAQALMQQLLAALSEGQHAAAERQRALTQQVGGSRAVLVGPRTADCLCCCLICTSEACHGTWTPAKQRLSGLMLPLRPCLSAHGPDLPCRCLDCRAAAQSKSVSFWLPGMPSLRQLARLLCRGSTSASSAQTCKSRTGQCAGFSRRCAALTVSRSCLSGCISEAEAMQVSIVRYSNCFGCMSRVDDANQEATARHCAATAKV